MLMKERVITITSLLIFTSLFCGEVSGQSSSDVALQARTSALRNLLGSIEGIAKEPPQVFKTREGYLRFIGAPPSTHFAAAAGTPEQVADAFLGKWRNLFINESSAVGFEVHRVKSRDSRSYVRYRQKYAGLEVFGAEMIVQVNAGNRVVAVISDIMRDTSSLDTKKVSLSPAIDALTAQKKGIEFLAEQYKKLEFEASAAVLMIYAPEVVGNKGAGRLVWKIEVGNIGKLLVKECVLVDAQNGEIALHYSLIYTVGRHREIYDCEGGVELPSTPARTEGQEEPYGVADVDLAYDYLGVCPSKHLKRFFSFPCSCYYQLVEQNVSSPAPIHVFFTESATITTTTQHCPLSFLGRKSILASE